jgi:hypothetical protein
VCLALESLEERTVPSVYFFSNIVGIQGDYPGVSDNITIDKAPFPDGAIVGLSIIDNGRQFLFLPSQVNAIYVQPGDGPNTINIENDLGIPVSINAVNTAINICPTGQNLDNIQGGIGISGSDIHGHFTDTLTINDQADAFNDTYSLGDAYSQGSNTVQRNARGIVSYDGMKEVVINGGSGATGGGSTYNINNTVYGPVTINASAGNDTFNVNLDDLGSPVTVHGNGGTDSLNIDNDRAEDFSSVYTITSSTVKRETWEAIAYDTVESLVVNGGSRDDTYNINSTAWGTPVTVNAGAGNDTFNVSPSVAVPSGSQDTLFGAVTVHGNGGSNSLNVNDQADAFIGDIYTITSSTVNRTAMAPIAYDGMQSLMVNGGSVGEAFNVNSTPSGTPVTVNGGAGNDTANVAGLPSGAALTFNLMGGHNTAQSSLPGPSNWQVSPSTAGVTKVTLGGSVIFAQVWNLIGGPGSDVFQFLANGSLGGTLNGGGGVNALDYSQYTAGVSVQLANAPALGTATGVGTGTGTVPTAAVSNIQNLVGSRSNDTLIGNDQDNVIQPWGGKDEVRGNGGNDTIRLIGLQDPASILDGGTGTNLLWAPDGVNTWTLTGPGAGKLVSTANTNISPLTFTNMQQLLGGLNTDIFQFVPPAPGSIIGNWFSYLNGNSGTNWLDYYWAYTGPVTVNLATSTATGVAGANVHFIQNVIGSHTAANNLTGDNDPLGNILVGGNAADAITGGNTRSILIGGQGNDVVTGGTADDIVIGGYTDYDHNEAALQAILSEWLSTTDSYTTRISKIQAGINSGGNNYQLIWETTVHDDSGPNGLGLDTLRGDPHGSSVTGLDWFFANLDTGPGRVLDSFPDGRQPGEKVNNN